MMAYQYLASKRRAFENHNQLSLLALAQAEGKTIEGQLKKWEKELD
jgi:hypothetical protein